MSLGRRARRLAEEALAHAGASIDRGALRLMERKMGSPGTRRAPGEARRRLLDLCSHYEQAELAATTSAFFPRPPAAVPALRRDGPGVVELRFASAYRPSLASYTDEHLSYGENLTAVARWYQGGGRRPVAICLHGWGAGGFGLSERAFEVDYLRRIGLDVVLFQLPFHGERSPRGHRSPRSLFPSPHLVRTNEAFGQAIWDLRALAGYLVAEGAPAIGAIGMSLGAYTAALWASAGDELDFAAAIIPAVSIAELMWRHGAGTEARTRAERGGASLELLERVFAVHSPLARPVRLPSARLLIVAGRGDRITPASQAEALGRHWGGPELVWFPGSHLLQVGRGDGFRALRRKLAGLGLIAPHAMVE